MVRSTTTAPVVNEDTTQVKALVLKNELTKIAAAGLGAVALATLIPKPGTDEEIQKGELMSGLSDYIRKLDDGWPESEERCSEICKSEDGIA